MDIYERTDVIEVPAIYITLKLRWSLCVKIQLLMTFEGRTNKWNYGKTRLKHVSLNL